MNRFLDSSKIKAPEAIIMIVAHIQARHILVHSRDLSLENSNSAGDRKQARLVAVHPSFSAKWDADVIRSLFGATGRGIRCSLI
jgi:hypothetical protein